VRLAIEIACHGVLPVETTFFLRVLGIYIATLWLSFACGEDIRCETPLNTPNVVHSEKTKKQETNEQGHDVQAIRKLMEEREP
jgi:hypothetical protein